MNSSSNDNGKARHAKSMAALEKLATHYSPPPEKVFHKIDPDELQEKVARMALWPTWNKMRAEDAAEKAKPSLTRPPCQSSTRLTRDKTKATLERLVCKPRPALRDCLSPDDYYAAAWAKVLEALRWFKGSMRTLMAARWASSRP